MAIPALEFQRHEVVAPRLTIYPDAVFERRDALETVPFIERDSRWVFSINEQLDLRDVRSLGLFDHANHHGGCGARTLQIAGHEKRPNLAAMSCPFEALRSVSAKTDERAVRENAAHVSVAENFPAAGQASRGHLLKSH